MAQYNKASDIQINPLNSVDFAATKPELPKKIIKPSSEKFEKEVPKIQPKINVDMQTLLKNLESKKLTSPTKSVGKTRITLDMGRRSTFTSKIQTEPDKFAAVN